MANKVKEKPRRRRGRKEAKEGGSKVEKGGHSSLLIQLTEDAPTWYQAAKDFPERNATLQKHPSAKPQPNHLVEKYRAQADEIYRQEVQLFNARVTTRMPTGCTRPCRKVL